MNVNAESSKIIPRLSRETRNDSAHSFIQDLQNSMDGMTRMMRQMVDISPK